MDTITAANKLIEYCNQGKFGEAIAELYADDARHIEAMEMPGTPRELRGKDNLLKMSEQWASTHEVHSFQCGKPLVNGDQFVCEMKLDVTSSEGPMAGQRMAMNETCVYTVANGKITEAKFFYSM